MIFQLAWNYFVLFIQYTTANSLILNHVFNILYNIRIPFELLKGIFWLLKKVIDE